MTDAPLIPLEVLLGNPEKAHPQISPGGDRTAYLASVDGVLNVWVGTTGGDDFEPVTDDRDRGIRAYAWAHDDRHLLYIQDEGGDENWRLYAVDLESGETTCHTPFDGVQAQLIAVRKHHPDVVLVGLNKDNPQLHDAYRLTLSSGELEKVAENPGFVAWVADHDLAIRAGVAPLPDGGMQLVVRDAEGADWRPLLVLGPEDTFTSDPIGFTLEGSSMYLQSSVGVNAARLVRVDLSSGEVTEVLCEDPTYDVVDVTVHPDTREPQLVGFMKDRREVVVLDPEVAEDIEAISRVHPGDWELIDRDHADTTWLVRFAGDDVPVSYYALDRRTKGATFLFDHRRELRDYTLAKMEPFFLTSRDGLELHGYLTFPPEDSREGLPTVLNVHGGPYTRDVWGFHPEAQFFANRGYLCVQVNFRGSRGYGKKFLNAGDKEWGGKMHDDLVDTVRWVVKQGYADPERVAIYGGSYGGYAALVGATFTPDLFRCAAVVCGPSNLKTFIETIPEYWKPLISMFQQRVGNPETEEEFLWSRSPLSRVEDIGVPMLVAHGANDPRVKQSESEQIVEAMRQKGIDHEYLVFEDEGHGFAKPENRLKFYAAAERFFAKHLGGRAG